MRTWKAVLAIAMVTLTSTTCVPTRAQQNGSAQNIQASAASDEHENYDIVIRNGRVLDGSGSPWILADVAISKGHFAKIGRVLGKGKREIDATGLYVSPGWIDAMDQSGESLLKDGLAESKLQEGVTTGIAGEDWASTPLPDKLGAHFAQMQSQGISINFGTLFSETKIRIAVLGYEDRKPTLAELETMKGMMAQAMRAGAMGMTTALIYPPSSYASTEELIEVGKVAGSYGGMYASHMRGEGKDVLEAVRELIEISDKGHLPAEIYHLKVAYPPAWGKLMPEVGKMVADARARGLEITGDLYVYTAGGTSLDATIPSWAHDGGDEALKKRLHDPAIRERLKREQVSGSPGWWNIVEACGGWNGIVLTGAANPAYAKYEGKTIAEIGKEMGKDPADVAFDIVEQAEGGNEGTSKASMIVHMMDEQDVKTALKFPWTSIGSDSGTVDLKKTDEIQHPRAFGNFPRVIARYVRDEHVLTLEEAVRKMTGWPAEQYRLAGRGLIRQNQWADVTIFNYEKIQDKATFEHPNTFPDGIEYVLVNGEVVMDHGKHTGAKPGLVLYGQGHTTNATASGAQ